ncbi:MAG: hypothetical protein KBG60_02555 [Anaerolineaceae bacterium]|nr:hypothetical protein [Anaerolineaceae bacterium]
MDTKIDWKVNIIIGEISELQEREDELTSNSDFLSMYLADWVNNLSRVSNIWKSISDEQRKAITQQFEVVKPIAMKLKLPWPEELSNVNAK